MRGGRGKKGASEPGSRPQARPGKPLVGGAAATFCSFLGFFCAVTLGVCACRANPPKIRPPAVAGQFYPADPAKLEAAVKNFFEKAPRKPGERAEALLVPHAGYAFSGQVAADGFAQAPSDFSRVFILTANHNPGARYHGVSLDDSDIYHVPGADITVAPLTRKLIENPLFLVNEPANSMHMVEVELPFLVELGKQAGNEGFEIVPMVLGTLNDAEIVEIAEILHRQGGEKPLYVFSLDLSHYFPYERAVALDRSCLDALLAKDRARVSRCTTDSTDRNSLLLILLELARVRGLEPDLVTYKNSGDVTGETDRVVGYAAVAFRPSTSSLAPNERAALLDLARKTLTQFVTRRVTYSPSEEELKRFPSFYRARATFVTLKKGGFLRGCIGSLQPSRPLWLDVRENTIAAASQDRRFSPVTEEELGNITVEISILSPLRPLAVAPGEEVTRLLRPGIDGVVLSFRGHRSTYLPEVWEELPDAEEFLSRLCRKQGSPAGCWKSGEASFETYETVHLGPG